MRPTDLACRLASLLVATLIAGQFLVPQSAGAQARRLQSRALFAGLDSAAIADSSAMEPLNPRDPQDSLMLAMVAFLDRRDGPDSGVSPTRIRHWDGYHTQAHPALGILVDRSELKHLFDSLRSLKGMMGVPAAAIQQRVSYVALFLVAHEHGHLRQYRRFGIPAVTAPDSTRLVECGADLLGGMAYRDFLASPGGSTVPREALPAAVDFGHVVGSTDWLDGTDYPLPEDRRKCIETGIEVAAALADLKAVRAGDTDSATSASARFLEESEPELYAGQLDLVEWSRLRARAILSRQSVVDSSAVFEVMRDSSVVQAVRRLAAAALKGQKEFRKLRAGQAPGRGAERGYLLRDALPTPWKCTIRDRRGSETALCVYQTIGEPDSEFLSTVALVTQALAATKWSEVTPEVEDPGDAVVVESPADTCVVFAPRGSDPRNDRTARVEVIRRGPAEPTAMTQAVVAVEFSLEIRVRAGR
jgi:hypothetical protein